MDLQSRMRHLWVWAAMLDRCRNPKNRHFLNYGGRGISVCERWSAFANFIDDMGERPSRSFTLERRENNGNYTPENCYWATRREQSRNKRRYRRNASGIAGVHKVRDQWRARIRVDGRLIHLGYFGNLTEAAAARAAAERTHGFSEGHGA
jgi:hypothetical protein